MRSIHKAAVLLFTALMSLPAIASDPAIATNPVNPSLAEIDGYVNWIKNDMAADTAFADNMITWQLDSGGFAKAIEKYYGSAWDGVSPRSEWISNGPINGRVELATIDNDATVKQICFLSYMYGKTGNETYKKAVLKAFAFLSLLQYPSGGFAQVYPQRENIPYSNMVTFNDDAMVRVLVLYDRAIAGAAPFDSDIITPELKASLIASKEKAIGFILKSQIVNDGIPTVWCAQHDPVTYLPAGARAYELPSKSGKESVLIAAYLLSLPRTAEIDRAVNGALSWFRKNALHLLYDNKGPVFFVEDAESTLWYRFYDIEQDKAFFCGRDGVKKYDVGEIEAERRLGYSWAGNYAEALLQYADSIGR